MKIGFLVVLEGPAWPSVFMRFSLHMNGATTFHNEKNAFDFLASHYMDLFNTIIITIPFVNKFDKMCPRKY